MMFDSDKRHRRSIRLLYGHGAPCPYHLPAGAYFVTICTQARACLFGHVVNGEMRLNDAGRMVRSVWEGLPDRFSGMELDAFVVMPNHVHGIIVIQGRGEASAVPFHVSKERPKSDASPLQPCSP